MEPDMAPSSNPTLDDIITTGSSIDHSDQYGPSGDLEEFKYMITQARDMFIYTATCKASVWRNPFLQRVLFSRR